MEGHLPPCPFLGHCDQFCVACVNESVFDKLISFAHKFYSQYSVIYIIVGEPSGNSTISILSQLENCVPGLLTVQNDAKSETHMCAQKQKRKEDIRMTRLLSGTL